MLQFANMTSSPNFMLPPCFYGQVQLLVQVFCQYHNWLWSYDNFCCQGIDQKSGNQKYTHLHFAQYLEIGANLATKFGKKLVNAPKCQGYRCFFFYQMISLQKSNKMFFVASKKLFSFLRYSNFCHFFLSFPQFPDSKGQMGKE